MENEQRKITICALKEQEIPIIAERLFQARIGKKYYPTKAIIQELLYNGFKTDAMYVAKDDSVIVGFIWFQRKGAFYIYPYLQMIYVRKSYRKYGIGQKLLDFFERASLEEQGHQKLKNKVFLCVGEWNQNAIQFYQKAGYVEVGTLPNLFRKKVNERLYMKECSSIKSNF